MIKESKSSSIVYSLALICLTCLGMQGQSVSIRKIIVEDSLINTLVDDYLATIHGNIDTNDFVVIYVDPRSYVFCHDCICEDRRSRSSFKLPIDRNVHEVYRFGLSIVPFSSYFLRDMQEHFKSSYLVRHKSYNVILVSSSLLIEAKTEASSIRIYSDSLGGLQHSFVNYEFEPGVGIYKVVKELIVGNND